MTPAKVVMTRLIEMLRQADWLTRDRVIAWGLVLFLEELLLLLFLALWQHGVFVPVRTPPASDFVSFYAAGKLALAGTPQLAYDQAAHYLAQQQTTDPGAPHQYFFYPPVYLILCAGLASMPYVIAFAVFQVCTLGLFIVTMRRVLRERGAGWLAPLLAFPAVFWTFGLGQNAFLTAALFGGFTLLVDKRPIGAGILLGALCYKPHFGLLVPGALIAGRRWTAFAAATATIAWLVGISIALFGWQTWHAYLVAFVHSGDVYNSGAIDFAGIVTPYGAARLLGFAPWPAYGIQGAAAMVMALLIALLWRRNVSRSVSRNMRAASLLSATLLAVPLCLLYDKLLVLVAIGWLVREARESGFLPWEKLVLLAVYPMSLLTWCAGQTFHLPLGPMITCMVLVLCLRRVWLALPGASPVRGQQPRFQALGASP
ncbi:MAG TPA: glycosyltransferase family 87 protein [Acetobacteraceae bacterium]|nr:glycosyltransferase family 87 protein [Acetobacteraceae bacterium]